MVTIYCPVSYSFNDGLLCYVFLVSLARTNQQIRWVKQLIVRSIIKMLFMNILGVYVAYFLFIVALLYVMYLFANKLIQRYLILKKEEIQAIKELVESIRNKG